MKKVILSVLASMFFLTAMNQNIGPIHGPIDVCQLQTSVLYYISEVPGASSYVWVGPGMTIAPPVNNDSIYVTFGSIGSPELLKVFTTFPSAPNSDTAFIYVTAHPGPGATASSNSPVCVGATLNLSGGPSGTGLTYSWIGPNGFVNGTQNPSISSVTLAAAGIYTLTVTNAAGCISTTTTTVIVNTLPGATASSNSPVCVGATLNLSGGPSGTGLTYAWSGPGGFVNSTQNPSISSVTLAAAGIYTLSVTNAAGCMSTTSTTVIVNTLPGAIASSNSPVCVGATLSLSGGPSGTGLTYAWNGPNGFVNSTQNPSISSVTLAAAGTYTLNVTNTLGCTSTASTTVNVNPLPVPTITGPAFVCQNSTNNTYTTEAGMTGYTWLISSGGSGTSTSNTISVNWNTVGSQSVSVSYTNSNSCLGSYVKPIIVNPLPVISGQQTTCTSVINTYSTTPGMTNYTWSLPSGGNFTPLITNTYQVTVTWGSIPGIYPMTVQYVNPNTSPPYTCTTLSMPYNVTLTNYAVPSITGPVSVCANQGGYTYFTEPGMTAYIWTCTGGTIPGPPYNNQTTVSWGSAGTGTLTVTYINPNGCQPAIPTQKTIAINPRPNPSITGPSTICVGTSAVYTTQSGKSGYNWAASGTTNTISQGNYQTTVTWSAPGAENVTVNYTEPTTGCSASAPGIEYVIVNSLPAPSINGPSTACANQSITYTTQTGMSNYIWTVSGGALPSPPLTGNDFLTVAWTSSGSISVTYTIPNSTCSGTSPTTNVTVSNNLQLTLTVSVDNNPVCFNTPVHFIAQANFPGTSPIYSWYVDGTPQQQSPSNIFTLMNPADGTLVMCKLQSSEQCLTANNVSSNTIKMLVQNFVVPTVTITPNIFPSCIGTTVKYGAKPTSGGNNPTYVWKRNANLVPAMPGHPDSLSLIPFNGDKIVCIMQSDLICASPQSASDTLTMQVENSIEGTIFITVDHDTVCENSPATFTAHLTGQGSNPELEWTVGGISVNEHNLTYSNGTVKNGDVVRCIYSGGLPCTIGLPKTSSPIIMHAQVDSLVKISISPLQYNTCAGTQVIFLATPTCGGTAPQYTWKVNNQDQHVNNASFPYTPNNHDKLICILNSSLKCKIGDPAESLPVNGTVSDQIIPAQLSVDKPDVCRGRLINLSSPDNPTLIKEWQKKYTTSSKPQKISGSDTVNSIIDMAADSGRVQYWTVIKSGVCPEVNSDPVSVHIINAPDPQTLVAKADQEHKKHGDLFLLCQTFTNDTLLYTYTWGYIKNNGDTVQLEIFKNKDFCLFPFRDTSYTYTLESGATGDNLCKTISKFKIQDEKSAISDNYATIYPSPNSGRFNLNLDGSYRGDVTINVRDIVGRVLEYLKVSKQAGRKQIPFDLKLSSGIYLVEIFLGNEEKLCSRVIVN